MMHTEADTQTVTNTLALYGVKPPRVWLRRVGITLAGLGSITIGTLAGHLIRCVGGW